MRPGNLVTESNPLTTPETGLDFYGFWGPLQARAASKQRKSFVVTSGMPEFTCIDTNELEAMVSALETANQSLDSTDRNISSAHSMITGLYTLKSTSLGARAAMGDTEAADEYDRLLAVARDFEEATTEVLNSTRGTKSLIDAVSLLEIHLQAATGIYNDTEGEVVSIFSKYALEDRLAKLATNIVGNLEFPDTFTLDGVTYDTRTMSDIQKSAIFLSWWQAKIGEKRYGVSRSFTLHTDSGEQVIKMLGYEDSPELNAAFQKYLEIPTVDLKRSLVSVLFPIPALLGIVPGIRQSEVNRVMGLGTYVLFSDWQKMSRAKALQEFGASVTGKAIGTTETSRLEKKRLGLSGPAYEINADGSVSRNFTTEVGDTFRYGNTMDPYGDRGAFEIQQFTTASGKKGARVILRGTETWDAGSGQVQDMLTNTQSVSGLKTEVQKAVEATLSQAGLDDGTPIELVGHSQAGIVAANMAADSGFNSRFNVKTLVTAGSPIGQVKLPETIQSLSLENSSDPVPKLEGAMNRTSPHHLTVYSNFVETLNPIEAHNRDSCYAKMADRIQSLHFKEVDNFLECRDKAMGFDEKIVEATTQRFEINRNFGFAKAEVRKDLT